MNTPLAIPAHAPASELRRLWAEILTTIAGVGAAIGVVAINVSLQRALDFDFLGLTFAFVIPAGALFGGMGAAPGYYIAARATNTLPSRRMLFEMLAIAFSTWMLMHWVEYASIRFADGSLVRDAISFWEYLCLRAEHLRLTLNATSGPRGETTSELGVLGYGHELLQIFGFLAGGLVIWLALKSREACERCSRYAQTKRLLQRAPSAVFDSVLARAGVALPSFADRVVHAVGKRRLVGLNLHIATCPACRRSWLRPAAVAMEGSHPIVRRIDAYDVNPGQASALLGAASSGSNSA